MLSGKKKLFNKNKVNQALKEKLGTNNKNSSKPPLQNPFRMSRSLDPQVESQGVILAILAT